MYQYCSAGTGGNGLPQQYCPIHVWYLTTWSCSALGSPGHLCTAHPPHDTFPHQLLQIPSSVCHPLDSLACPYSTPPSILWHKTPHAIIGLSHSSQQSLGTGLDPVASLPHSSFRACACTWQHAPSYVAHPHASIDLPHEILTAYRVFPCPIGSLTISLRYFPLRCARERTQT